jgi:hypothetical protein
VATNLAAGLWGAFAWLRSVPSKVFWYLLRLAQAAVVTQVGLGALLLVGGRHPPQDLHLVYGILPLAVVVGSEAMRAGATQKELAGVQNADSLNENQQIVVAKRVVRREIGIMAVAALLIVSLALRAAATGGAI